MAPAGGELPNAPPTGREVTSEGSGERVSIPWRLAIFVLASSVGVLGLRAVMSVLGVVTGQGSGGRFPSFVLTLAGGMLIGHWWTFRVVERKGWEKIGFGRAALSPRAIAIGASLGAVAVGLPSALLLALGWLRVEPSAAGDSVLAALYSLGLLVPAALWEELLARGYLFALVRERWGARVAIVATSVLFGLIHLENAGATVQSIALVTLAGMFLGSILVSLGSLYAAWAAHVAWNFVMAGVLHTSVSGFAMGAPDYRTVDTGPDWATGGNWGPEAGLFAGAAMLAAMYFLLRRRAGSGKEHNVG